jgi:hypothetical protein
VTEEVGEEEGMTEPSTASTERRSGAHPVERSRIALVLGGAAFFGLRMLGVDGRADAASRPEVIVYKSPTCGCCAEWVVHLRRHGFQVKTEDLTDLQPIKTRHGVPSALQSCHTALVGGYVVEGHVPAELVDRLLRERPRAVGIAVPGMPVGSPGMEVPGRPADRYQVVTFDRSGQTGVFATR